MKKTKKSPGALEEKAAKANESTTENIIGDSSNNGKQQNLKAGGKNSNPSAGKIPKLKKPKMPAASKKEQLIVALRAFIERCPDADNVDVEFEINMLNSRHRIGKEAIRGLYKCLRSEEKQKQKNLKPEGEGSDPNESQGSGSTALEQNTPDPTQAKILLDLSQVDAEFFHAPDETGYVTFKVNSHYETRSINSSRYKKFLRRLFLQHHGKPPQAQAVADAVSILEAQALEDGRELPIYVRIAPGSDGTVYLDLCDKEWQAVWINDNGWEIIKNPPVKFVRYPGMASLPVPESGGDLDLLRDFVSPKMDDDTDNNDDGSIYILTVGWLLNCFNPNGLYLILILQGGQGTGKTLRARILRLLIDPSTALVRTLPDNSRDLMIAARNSWVQTYDNISGLKNEVSDDLCRLSTGGGIAPRKLYTDDEQAFLDAMRPVILTGIDDIATRGDLQERSIIQNLPKILKKMRQSEKQLIAKFKAKQGKILGALLDMVSGIVKEFPNAAVDELPRMADACMWVTAAEKALGWEAGTFVKAFNSNQRAAIETGLQADSLAVAVREFVDTVSTWSGNATALLERLKNHADYKYVESKYWPNIHTIKNRLMRLQGPLAAVGIEYAYLGHGVDGSQHSLRKVPLNSSETSASSKTITEELF